MMKTAEQLREEKWSGHKQYSIYRHGKSDGIVVLLDNPPVGRCRSPMVEFLIFKDGIEVDYSSNYEDMRRIVKRLKSMR